MSELTPMPAERLVRSVCDTSGDYDDNVPGRTGATFDPETGVLVLRYDRDPAMGEELVEFEGWNHRSTEIRFQLVVPDHGRPGKRVDGTVSNNSDWAEIFSILATYDEVPAVSAEHDELWVGITGGGVTESDRARLLELGLTYDSEDGGFHAFT